MSLWKFAKIGLFVSLLFFSGRSAFAASYAAVDSFESYSAGSISGGSGGTGWSGNWTGAQYVVMSDCESGYRCVAKGSEPTSYRTFAESETGELTLYAKRVSSESPGQCYIALYSGSTQNFIIYKGSGAWTVFKNGSYQSTGNNTNDVYVKLTINWDAVAQPDSFRFKFNDGTYSDWFTGNGTLSGITKLVISQDGDWNQGCKFDDISYVASESPSGGGGSTTPSATSTDATLGYIYLVFMTSILFPVFIIGFTLSIIFWLLGVTVAITED